MALCGLLNPSRLIGVVSLSVVSYIVIQISKVEKKKTFKKKNIPLRAQDMPDLVMCMAQLCHKP